MIALFTVQQGCASFSLDRLFGTKKLPELGKIGIVSLCTGTEVKIPGGFKSGMVSHNGTLGVAVTSGVVTAALGAAWICLPNIILPPVYAGCVAAMGVTGFVAGAAIGLNSAASNDTELVTAITPTGMDLQEAVRTQVITLADAPGRNVIDLGTLSTANSDDSTSTSTPGSGQLREFECRIDYQAYTTQGLQTVLEINLSSVEFKNTGTDTYQPVLRGTSRLINTGDGKEIMRKTHKYNGPKFYYNPATAGNETVMQAVQAGIEAFAGEIVHTYFIRNN